MTKTFIYTIKVNGLIVVGTEYFATNSGNLISLWNTSWSCPVSGQWGFRLSLFFGCQSNLLNRVIHTMKVIISSKRKMKFFTHNLLNYFLNIMCEHTLLIIYVWSYTTSIQLASEIVYFSSSINRNYIKLYNQTFTFIILYIVIESNVQFN